MQVGSGNVQVNNFYGRSARVGDGGVPRVLKRFLRFRKSVRLTRRTGTTAAAVVTVTIALVLLTIYLSASPRPSPALSARIVVTGTPFATLANTDNYQILGSLAFTLDSKTIAAAGIDGFDSTGHVYQWKVAPGNQQVHGKTAGIPSGGVTFNATGALLAAGSRNGIFLWDRASSLSRPALVVDPDKSSITEAISYSPAQDILAEGDYYGRIYLLDLASKKWRTTYFSDPDNYFPPGDAGSGAANLTDVAISAPGNLVAASDNFGNVFVWDIGNPQHPIKYFDNAAPVSSDVMAFSPDGKTLAIADGDTQSDNRDVTLLWKVGSTASPVQLRVHNASPEAEAFNQDGKILATGDSDGTIYLWDVATHKMVGRIGSGIDNWEWLMFSPDGKTLAAVSSGNDKISLYSIKYSGI